MNRCLHCDKEIKYGRSDKKFCNKSCKMKKLKIDNELKNLNRISIKTRKFIDKSNTIHNFKYEYDKTLFINCRINVTIKCPIHGYFEQTPSNHLYNSSGCSLCSRDDHKLTLLSSDRISNMKSVHKNRYAYNDLFINNSYINIECPDHGTFSQYIYYHEYGHGCPKCVCVSRGENSIDRYLSDREIKFYKNYTFDGCVRKRKLKFDFYLPKYNTVIEYDGEHHFEDIKYFGNNNKYIVESDKIKEEYCKVNDIKIIRIPYWDFYNIDIILDAAFK